MRTSELAARAGVNPQTLRYYERRGLLPAPPRTPGGYRSYDDSALQRLRFVHRARSVGFTLADIETLLHLTGEPASACAKAGTVARTKLTDIEQRISDLHAMRELLSRLLVLCDDSEDRCAMLDDLLDATHEKLSRTTSETPLTRMTSED